MSKPSNPQGTRDFSPEVMIKRQYILDAITSVYRSFGFEPLETPALENLDTLTGKYGEEGDKLLYKIRSNKEITQELDDQKAEALRNLIPNRWIPGRSKLGLRYDLTVPFARFVVQNQHQITFPFRRYQVQNVWRADRPQKGRFREFTQCDADAIGSDSLLHEADLIQIYGQVFKKLGLPNAVLKLNHRKLLEAMAESMDPSFDVARFTTTLDKLDKIGKQGVIDSLTNQGIATEKARALFEFIQVIRFDANGLLHLKSLFKGQEKALLAIQELETILEWCPGLESFSVQLDLSLARGLDYYTGSIFEAVVPDSGIGSISGGGRYDDLTGVFGLKGVSGVGISFGIDRIYEILESQNLWPESLKSNQAVLIVHFNQECMKYAQVLAFKMREKGLSVMVYPDQKKINKQFDFANKKDIQKVIVIGESEMHSDQPKLKDMASGTQEAYATEELIDHLLHG